MALFFIYSLIGRFFHVPEICVSQQNQRTNYGVMVNILNFEIIVSEIKISQEFYIYFSSNVFWKDINSIIPRYFSTRIDLAVNKPPTLICH